MHAFRLSFDSHHYRVESLAKVFDRVVDASVCERRRNHCEQVIDDHLGKVQDFRMLLVLREQVPI